MHKTLHGTCLAVILVIAISSCTSTNPEGGPIAVVDFETAYKIPIEPHFMSEFVSRIEYVKLETNPDCFVESMQAVAFSENYLAVYEYPSKRIMIFTKKGKYLNDIGSVGQGPGEYTGIVPTSLMISPDEKYVAFRDFDSKVYLFNLDGFFRGRIKPPAQVINEILFDDSGSLIIFQAQHYLPDEGGYLILKYDENLALKDSLFFRKPDPSALGQTFVLDAMVSYKNDLYYREVFKDTVYRMKDDSSLEPSFLLKLGDVKLPSYQVSREEVSLKYLLVEALHLSDQYFMIKLTGRARNPAPNTGTEEFVWFNRQTNEVTLTHPFLTNDLDGIYEHRIAWPPKNGGFWDRLNVVDAKELIEAGSVKVEELATPIYYDELNEILERSDIEDNPIIRIFHLK